MTNPARSVAPLDVLQSTLDGIFIEIGNSLYISDKVPPKTLMANANARLRSAIPKAIETFHQALDDIETDIVRAKAVLLRDLEEARAKRIALENPPPEAIDDLVKNEPTAGVLFPQDEIMAESNHLVPPPKLEDNTTQLPWEELASLDPPKDIDSKEEPGIQTEAQDLPLPSSNDVNTKAETVDLNKNLPSTADDLILANDTLDPLLDISADNTADNNNNDDLNIIFDDMDFSQFTTNNEETSQSQQNDFLSNFGNDVQDFALPNLHTASNADNLNSTTEDKKDDLFELANNTTGDDLPDIDFLPAEESSFNDLFAHAVEENETFDSDFFNVK